MLRWGVGGCIAAVLIAALGQFAVLSEPAMAAAASPPAASPNASAGPSTVSNRIAHVQRHKDQAAFEVAKARANDLASRSAKPSTAAPGGPKAPASVYNGNNFGGLTSNGTETPSDSTGDASPTQQVEMVNSSFAVFPGTCGACGLNGGSLYNLAAASLSDCVFDPQVAWDQQWGRWIYAMVVQHSSAPGGCIGDVNNANITDDKLIIGWTYTSDANDFLKYNVCINFFDTGSLLDDFPKLGHDDNSITVGANVFSNFGNGSFLNSEVWVMPKPPNVSLASPCGIGLTAPTKVSLGGVFTPVPADMTDASPVDYIVAAQSPAAGSANTLFVWQSSVSSGVVYLTFVGYFGVASYGVPPDVPQPSTGSASCSTAGNCLDAGDARLTQAIGRYDPDTGYEAVWTQHAITDPRFPTRSIERWYELVPATLAVRQSGNISDPSLYIFNGAVSPSAAGNEAVIFYNAASSDLASGLVSYRAQSRNRLSAPGSMSNETVLATSTANDSDFSCGVSHSPMVGSLPCRWGDYSAARPDPANPNGVWGFGMLAGSGGSATSAGWATQVAEMTPGCSTVNLNGASAGGSTVQFTASGPGGPTSGAAGCSNPQYQFWLQPPNGTWQIMQPFGGSNVWNWSTTSYRPGIYKIVVWANQLGDSPASAESFAITQWTIPFCTSAGLSPNLMSPQPTGTQVILTAASGCPNPNPLYQFWLLPPGGSWRVVEPYSTSATFTWITTGDAPGDYLFSVWVRDASSSGAFGTPPATYDAYGVSDFVLAPAPCTGMTATTTPASTATIGATVSVTGAATGCPNPRYEFWLLPPGGTWTLVQPYSANATFTWNTTGMPAGPYLVSAWARDVTSSSSYDKLNALPYSLTVAPCTGLTTASAPMSTASVGTTVTITGNTTGCPNPRYQFWMLPPGGTWTRVQPYSISQTYTWNTSGSAAGPYLFSVWARDVSSSAAYDAFSAVPYALTVAPCTWMSATASPPSTASSGTTVTITGSATGCPNARYQFWMLPPGGTWTLVQPYSTSPTYTWNTAGSAAGPYLFSVWARDVSSSAAYDVFGAVPYTLTLAPCTGMSATASPPSPASVGTTVTITGSATGCPNPRYQFWLLPPGGIWTLVQPYSAGATYMWKTTGGPAGQYMFSVWARDESSSSSYDAFSAFQYTLS